ncbi:uncharacterized protein LOC111349122 [Spodoptera litura]|uniref:Uncharacterized protein LOC111349122 n=1 Tax=Spodoptera litura TaxID=69820 RepID=A0A9J7IK46_SPOLT|nr:uncharacterized protein LOC111349122 [Spodoptera litura]
MAKCGGCGKFISSAECIRCTRCPGAYHPGCVGFPAAAKVSPTWLCPGCKAKAPRQDNSATPVKSAMADCCTETQNPLSDPAASATDLNVAYEIRCFRQELGAMRDEFRQFQSELLSLRMTVNDCNQRMTTIESKVSDIERRFEEQSPANFDAVEASITALKTQLNDRDQELLQNDLIIAGIPETKGENAFHTVRVLSAKLGVTMDEQDIVNIERIGAVRRNFIEGVDTPPGEPRARVIAVRLARRGVRDQLLRAARVRRGLTAADLDVSGPPRRVYVNERLTQTNSKLFHSAREAGQRARYRYVWTKDGRIYARKEDGAPAQRIRSDADLAQIFGSGRVG